MKRLILAAGALALSAATAGADEIVTRQTEAGVYSAPVAGATPAARAYPAPGTTMLETREKTTYARTPSGAPEATVAEPAPEGPVVAEPGVIERRGPHDGRYELNTQARERTPNRGAGTSRSKDANDG